jgi:kynureninase
MATNRLRWGHCILSDFRKTKSMFYLPEGVIYLDGNSLGPLPKAAQAYVSRAIQDEWGEMLIRAWNDAHWMELSTGVGDRIGSLIGAEKGHVVMGDTLSIKVYQALASALEMRRDRKVILTDNGNFPSDLYMAQGLVKSLDQGHEIRCVNPENVMDNIDESVAVMMLTEVDYRTGRKHDMLALTEKARSCDVVTVWDLAHSAGAVPVDVAAAKVDFAVGCTYKYLNGGPGSPAFIYVAPAHACTVRPALSGWLGHEAPFNFDLDYRPGTGIERMRVGTPPVIALKILESALDIWDQVKMADVRKKSITLSNLFIAEIEARCPDLHLASPRSSDQRGSQVSFEFKNGYAAMRACIDRGVIGDYRAPDIMRFGFTPLYIDEEDVMAAVDVIEDVITNRRWDAPEYQIRARVT